MATAATATADEQRQQAALDLGRTLAANPEARPIFEAILRLLPQQQADAIVKAVADAVAAELVTDTSGASAARTAGATFSAADVDDARKLVALLRSDEGARKCYAAIVGEEEASIDGLLACYEQRTDDLGPVSYGTEGRDEEPDDLDALAQAWAARSGTEHLTVEHVDLGTAWEQWST